MCVCLNHIAKCLNQNCKNDHIHKTKCSESDAKDTSPVASHLQHVDQMNSSNITFPLLPPTTEPRQKTIHDFCDATTPLKFQAGCAQTPFF